ncbi:soluble lytic murein transglycosylase [Clostridiales bacterium]|nr:soluble lytic murein transglycosylase [Clostridiales bacterium]
MRRQIKCAAVAVLAVAALLFYRFYMLPEIIYPIKYNTQVDRYAQEYELDRTVVYAVIKAESSFNESSCSRTGARGLMQIMPETGEWAAQVMGLIEFEDDDLYEAETNIHIGCWYLRYLLDMYDGNLPTALAAYNAGLGNVSKWLDDPNYSGDGASLHTVPYKETESYVEKTLRYMKKYQKYHGELGVNT